MCIHDFTHNEVKPFAELFYWLNAVASVGRRNKAVTVPYHILSLPCGCKREEIEGAHISSTLKRPVTREFNLKQVGGENKWVHLGCPNGATIQPN